MESDISTINLNGIITEIHNLTPEFVKTLSDCKSDLEKIKLINNHNRNHSINFSN